MWKFSFFTGIIKTQKGASSAMRQTLYFNGDILTMDDLSPNAQAVLTEDGIIRHVGTMDEVLRLADETAVKIDLQHRTLMPAFLDPHSHVTALASTMRLTNLQGTQDFEEIAARLAKALWEHPAAPGEWLMGFGYDHNALKEQRHPTRELLDEVSQEVPILITHASGHMGVVNSAGLRLWGITAQTPDPEGGVIGRQADSQPSGYLEENAFMEYSRKVAPPSFGQIANGFMRAQQSYLEHGITTIQDGKLGAADFELLQKLARQGLLKADVVGYIDLKGSGEVLRQHEELEEYQDQFRLGGYKLFLDGSPQGKTAWLTQPYQGSEDGYCGYPVYTDEQVQGFFRQVLEQRQQMLVHCNGDAACEQMLRCMETLRLQTGCDWKPLRPVMIHAQLLRKDQMQRVKELGIIPSFFVAHTYHWGDVHLQNLGDRARSISPAGSAMRHGIPFTFHQDTPVIEPDMMETIWCAVQRTTRQGIQLSEEERIPVSEALKAVTVYAAYQYFEEDSKGSISPGKLADLIVLSENPLRVPAERLREIQVLRTIKDGECVYERDISAPGAQPDGTNGLAQKA